MTSDETISSLSDHIDELSGLDARGTWHSDASPVQFWLAWALPTLPLLMVYLLETVSTRPFAFTVLAFLLVGFLFWRRIDGPIRRPTGWSRWSTLGAAALAVVLAILMAYPWFSAVAFVLVAGAFLSGVPGDLRRNLVSLTAPLICILKPPFQLDVTLASWLSRSVAWFSSIFLDRFEIPHSLHGSVVQLINAEVLIADVSGGFVSFYFVLFLAFSIVAWKQVSLWLLPFYAAAALLTTIAVNTLRVVLHVFSIHAMETDLTTTWYSVGLTVASALIAFGLLYSIHHLIAVVFHFIEANQNAGVNPLVYVWNRFSVMSENLAFEDQARRESRGALSEIETLSTPVWRIVIGFASLLTMLSIVQAIRSPESDDEAIASVEALLIPNEKLFSSINHSNIKLGDYEFTLSDRSTGTTLRRDTWSADFRGANIQVQVTQPLIGWWELTNGYEKVGWEILDRDTVVADDAGIMTNDDSSNPSFVYARLRQTVPTALEGYLLFSAISANGTVIDSPTALGSLMRRVRRRIGLRSADDQSAVAMIQLWAVSAEKLSPADAREIRGAFADYRDAFASAIHAKKAGTSASEVQP